MSNSTAAIIRKIRDLLKKDGKINSLVHDQVHVALDADVAPESTGFLPPAITVAPGQVDTTRFNSHARAETLLVTLTAFTGPAFTEEELLLGGNGCVGLVEIIEAIDELLDNKHVDGGSMDAYFRCEKRGEGKGVLLDPAGTPGLWGSKSITFEIEDQPQR